MPRPQVGRVYLAPPPDNPSIRPVATRVWLEGKKNGVLLYFEESHYCSGRKLIDIRFSISSYNSSRQCQVVSSGLVACMSGASLDQTARTSREKESTSGGN